MSLEDLNKEIYKSDSSIENRHHEESKYDPLSEMKEDVKEFKEDEKKKWVKTKKELTLEQKKAIKIGAYVLGGIIVILLIVLAVVKISQAAFNEKNVSVSITGDNNVSGNQTVNYKIIVKNNNWVSLKNAKISLNYSGNFAPQGSDKLKIEDPANSYINVGSVRFKSQVEYDISGTFFAPQDFVVYLNAALSYSSFGSNSFFQAKNQFGVNVKDSPITLETFAPQELSSGDQIEYLIDYKNDSVQSFKDVQLKVEYPDNFSYLSSSQETAGAENLWNLGTLNPGQEGKITVQGTLGGAEGEIKILKAYVGLTGTDGVFVAYNQQYTSTKLVESPLSITQTVSAQNNIINSGDALNYTISYKNQSDIGYTNAVITFEIQDGASILDFSHLKIGNNGYFDNPSKTITWKASDIAQLGSIAPGQGGTINLTIPVLKDIPVASETDKNFQVVTAAKIDSPDLPASSDNNKIIGSNTLKLKLNSKVVLSVSGFYDDANISNSGPIPPKVGQVTSYTIHFKVTNISNDISNLAVSSSLPSGVKWDGKIYPDGEKIEYNSQTNQITWQIGDLPSGIGVINPPKEVAFQVSITPQINQVDQPVTLLNPSVLTAKDTFTGSDIKVQIDEKTTQLPEDSQLGGKYAVTQ